MSGFCFITKWSWRKSTACRTCGARLATSVAHLLFPWCRMEWIIFIQSHRPLRARLSFPFPRHLASKLAMRGNEKASAISCADFVLHGDHQVELAGMYSMPHLQCSPRHIRGSSAISLARYRVDHLHTKPLSASRPSVFSISTTSSKQSCYAWE